MKVNNRIGIIGVGNIGEALISGLLKARVSSQTNIFASDFAQQRYKYIAKTYKVFSSQSNTEVVLRSNIITDTRGSGDHIRSSNKMKRKAPVFTALIP